MESLLVYLGALWAVSGEGTPGSIAMLIAVMVYGTLLFAVVLFCWLVVFNAVQMAWLRHCGLAGVRYFETRQEYENRKRSYEFSHGLGSFHGQRDS